ncbi:DUF262 domain-containing protein [Peribacillus sp. NPDC006672]|uniref:DUF262 domain-containing protein n=1 Tax=Peribacillus sp. NPDC006672 TaxID=3390606 RepID=UPI003CFF7679
MDLLQGEILDFNNFKQKKSKKINVQSINEKYLKGDTRIVTESARYPLNQIVSMVESEDYELNPDFQRRHRWDLERKSKLIESFIMNVPIPPIFLYEERFSYYEVMDGLQRLTAIYEFYTDKFALEGLEEWEEINGLRYSELPDQIKKGIDRRYLSSIILLQETAKSTEEAARMKQLVFERLNSGGIKLEAQETRNALYDGPLNKLCLILARNTYLCRMWDIPEEDFMYELLENDSYRKMEDVELVLRFFAFRQIEKYESSSLKEFLDFYLKYGNRFEKDVLDQFKILFENTVELVYEVFGDHAFYLWRKRKNHWNWYKKPTKVAFDPIMYTFCEFLSKKDKIIKNKEKIFTGLTDFYEEYYKEFEGRNTNRNNVIKRIELFRKYLENILEADDES